MTLRSDAETVRIPTIPPVRPRRGFAVALLMGVSLLAANTAFSQTPPAAEAPAEEKGILERDKLLGDMGGLRSKLEESGITITITDTNEVLGNVSGGIQRGATYDGLTNVTIQLDTQKAFGWEGGLFNVSGLNIRGRSLSQYNIGNLQNVSGISASDTTRVWEAWFQQGFWGGKADVKLGMQSIDNEFITSTGAAVFMNTAFGWPMGASANLYAGGPAYPLSSLGVRLRGRPTDEITVLGGVFQDNPPGGAFYNDSQLLGSSRWGGNANLRTGALVIGEVQYGLNQPGEDGKSTGLPGTYKLGFWYDTAAFPNKRYAQGGLSLADPASNGIPIMNRNNFMLYGVIDQTVWKAEGDSPRALNVFMRVMGGPGDRNLVSFALNAGVTLTAPLPGRDDDTFGIAFGMVKIGSGATGLDQDVGVYSGGYYPVRTNESFIEVTYQAKVTPWLTMQPDFQYIIRPGGGVPNPNNPTQLIGNAAVFGLRSVVTF